MFVICDAYYQLILVHHYLLDVFPQSESQFLQKIIVPPTQFGTPGPTPRLLQQWADSSSITLDPLQRVSPSTRNAGINGPVIKDPAVAKGVTARAQKNLEHYMLDPESIQRWIFSSISTYIFCLL